MAKRTALLIRCSAEEATKTREEAAEQRRTMSAYVLNIVLRSLPYEEMRQPHRSALSNRRASMHGDLWAPSPRTAILVRCSQYEAARIRAAANRRQATISGFVLHALRRAWAVKEAAPALPLPTI